MFISKGNIELKGMCCNLSKTDVVCFKSIDTSSDTWVKSENEDYGGPI